MSPENIDVTLAQCPTEPLGPQHIRCRSITPILQRIGDKWSILIVMMLAHGPRRFNELKRLVDGISQRMLTLNLRGLEREGLISRKIFPTIPPKVEYALTDLGKSLCMHVIALGRWAEENYDAIDAARQAFDARNEADDPLSFADLPA
ncbi:MAG TPA: helix-turn-helix domain-containing protein [Sphingomonas sp.]|uniref:winged helix-turn-helix transcriptional regulator n=1 Tax=Sphingomonas sp. TaxID=28214 RepID=UPI002CB1001F|nr:helix-turn-helix domain-containing protein [Sphingomonas sp.]HMI18176.1 helix-turn-helix domain-containing protein [Sphingomonas sp.]